MESKLASLTEPNLVSAAVHLTHSERNKVVVAAREALERFRDLEPKENPRGDLMAKSHG